MEQVAAAVRAGRFGNITSVIVSHEGQIVWEEYGDGDEAQLRNTRSCTKTVASLLVGLAIEDGAVEGVDARVHELLGRDEPDPRRAAISVRDLLTMSSCLACDDSNPSSPGNEERMYPMADWVGFTLGLPTRRASAERRFSYCTAGVVLLGAALERAVGEPLSAFAARRLFAPLGIERARWPRMPNGGTSTAGGLLLTSRSLCALGNLVLQDGAGIVPEGWLRESTRAHVRVDDETEYGYLWWRRALGGRRSLYMSGYGGNRVHVFPEHELVVVVTSTNFGVPDAHALTDELVAEVVSGG